MSLTDTVLRAPNPFESGIQAQAAVGDLIGRDYETRFRLRQILQQEQDRRLKHDNDAYDAAVQDYMSSVAPVQKPVFDPATGNVSVQSDLAPTADWEATLRRRGWSKPDIPPPPNPAMLIQGIKQKETTSGLDQAQKIGGLLASYPGYVTPGNTLQPGQQGPPSPPQKTTPEKIAAGLASLGMPQGVIGQLMNSPDLLEAYADRALQAYDEHAQKTATDLEKEQAMTGYYRAGVGLREAQTQGQETRTQKTLQSMTPGEIMRGYHDWEQYGINYNQYLAARRQFMADWKDRKDRTVKAIIGPPPDPTTAMLHPEAVAAYAQRYQDAYAKAADEQPTQEDFRAWMGNNLGLFAQSPEQPPLMAAHSPVSLPESGGSLPMPTPAAAPSPAPAPAQSGKAGGVVRVAPGTKNARYLIPPDGGPPGWYLPAALAGGQ
jgi:hypothetical protein